MQIILDENVDSRGHLTAGSTTKKIKIKVFVNHSLRMSIDIFVVDKITAAGIVWTYSILTETDQIMDKMEVDNRTARACTVL